MMQTAMLVVHGIDPRFVGFPEARRGFAAFGRRRIIQR
jgi:hypothetical protein